MKLSDLVKQVNMKKLGVTEEQILDCIKNPGIPKGQAFDSDIYAKQLGDKVLIAVCKQDTVVTIEYTHLTNELKHYKNAGELYQIAFSATGDKSFYNSGPGHEVWGRTTKG